MRWEERLLVRYSKKCWESDGEGSLVPDVLRSLDSPLLMRRIFSTWTSKGQPTNSAKGKQCLWRTKKVLSLCRQISPCTNQDNQVWSSTVDKGIKTPFWTWQEGLCLWTSLVNSLSLFFKLNFGLSLWIKLYAPWMSWWVFKLWVLVDSSRQKCQCNILISSPFWGMSCFFF